MSDPQDQGSTPDVMPAIPMPPAGEGGDQEESITQPAKLLRCNFIMRGVQVPAGQHVLAFEFQPSLTGLKISLAAIAIGVVLCGLLFLIRQPGEDPMAPNSMETKSTATSPRKK